jgi:hypothetical protein
MGESAMAITFAPRLAFAGFDRSVTPKWQMVPVGGTRVLTITGAGGLVPRVRVVSGDAACLTAAQATARGTTTLTLTGGAKPGRAFVEWVPSLTDAGPVQVGFTLEVSVKDEKKISTAFHYVDDGRKQKTSRKIADLNAMIVAANAILTPQANVKIDRKSAAALPIAQDLGRVVRFSSHLTGPPDNVPIAQHEWDDVVAHADTTADFNVFFVREYEQDNTPLVDNDEAGTLAAEKNCLFEDRIGYPPGEVLAHETVHLLGISPHSANRHHLIAGANRTGRLVTRDQANTINTSGT